MVAEGRGGVGVGGEEGLKATLQTWLGKAGTSDVGPGGGGGASRHPYFVRSGAREGKG